MSADDVVESLKGWRHWHETRNAAVLDEICQRARDEIVALREDHLMLRHDFQNMRDSTKKTRAEALEEAAKVCERQVPAPELRATIYTEACERCAAAIRALKNKRDE
jgi:hypothetical protein